MNVNVLLPDGPADGAPVSSITPAAHGLNLLAAGCFQEALSPLRLAISRGDTDPATVLNLAIAEDRAGDRSRARQLMQIVARSLPEWDEPILRLAESLRAAGDRTAAEEAYRQTLGLNPSRVEAMIALAGLLLLRTAAEEARDLLLRCCTTAPDNAEAWNTLGLAFEATGDLEAALAAFTTAQRLKPDHISYWVNSVEAAVRAGTAEAEHRRLADICAHDPLNPAPLAARAMLLERMGGRAEAIDVLEAACALAPDALTPLRLLGGLLTRSGQMARAEAVMRRIVERDPDDPQARNDHAVTLMRLHRPAEAQALLLDMLESDGPHGSVLCNLANATSSLGLQAEAVAIARRAIELQPDTSLPRRALCNTLPYPNYG
jgi:tetratricopeptide (TPR) repeat protein